MDAGRLYMYNGYAVAGFGTETSWSGQGEGLTE